MKKIFLLFTIMLFVLSLASCMKEEDYYTNAQVDEIVSAAVEQAISDLRIELTPTQLQRYTDSLFAGAILAGNVQFANIGDTITGTVEGWSYGYIVIELESALTVDIRTAVTAPNGDWNLNIYFNGKIENADLSFDEIANGDVFTVTLRAGFNTIEIDSYTSTEYNFNIQID